MTIPRQVRRALGLEPGDEVDIVVDGDVARIVPASGARGRGRRVVESLLGKGDVPLTTAEIMAMTRDGRAGHAAGSNVLIDVCSVSGCSPATPRATGPAFPRSD